MCVVDEHPYESKCAGNCKSLERGKQSYPAAKAPSAVHQWGARTQSLGGPVKNRSANLWSGLRGASTFPPGRGNFRCRGISARQSGVAEFKPVFGNGVSQVPSQASCRQKYTSACTPLPMDAPTDFLGLQPHLRLLACLISSSHAPAIRISTIGTSSGAATALLRLQAMPSRDSANNHENTAPFWNWLNSSHRHFFVQPRPGLVNSNCLTSSIMTPPRQSHKHAATASPRSQWH
jgi:hypothetical protein